MSPPGRLRMGAAAQANWHEGFHYRISNAHPFPPCHRYWRSVPFAHCPCPWLRLSWWFTEGPYTLAAAKFKAINIYPSRGQPWGMARIGGAPDYHLFTCMMSTDAFFSHGSPHHSLITQVIQGSSMNGPSVNSRIAQRPLPF